LDATVVGLDYVPAMCHVANAKAKRYRAAMRCAFVVGDSKRPPFVEAVYDVVIASVEGHMHHAPRQQFC